MFSRISRCSQRLIDFARNKNHLQHWWVFFLRCVDRVNIIDYKIFLIIFFFFSKLIYPNKKPFVPIILSIYIYLHVIYKQINRTGGKFAHLMYIINSNQPHVGQPLAHGIRLTSIVVIDPVQCHTYIIIMLVFSIVILNAEFVGLVFRHFFFFFLLVIVLSVLLLFTVFITTLVSLNVS